jgi:hypothetical protein
MVMLYKSCRFIHTLVHRKDTKRFGILAMLPLAMGKRQACRILAVPTVLLAVEEVGKTRAHLRFVLWPELGSGVRRRASAVRQWSGGRRGPNSGEWHDGVGQGASARTRLGPWEGAMVVEWPRDRVQGSLGNSGDNCGRRHDVHA